MDLYRKYNQPAAGAGAPGAPVSTAPFLGTLNEPQRAPNPMMQRSQMGSFGNIAGPGIRPAGNLAVNPNAQAPVRSAPQVMTQAAAPTTQSAAQTQQQQSDPAADVMKNYFLARAMGLMG